MIQRLNENGCVKFLFYVVLGIIALYILFFFVIPAVAIMFG